ncbi:hypothetical protein ACHAWU_007209 [Discostella pseudostelligera]|uniref:Uncharacterized protein n=1 Tax=Discostella pseudostelligera TaxID=259834 RepID=A0ABD3LWY2_9STRA
MAVPHSIHIFILMCMLLPCIAYAFLQQYRYRQPNAFCATITSSSASCKKLCMSSSSDAEEDDADGYDDDESIDPNSLGDWRTFRMNLANSDTLLSSASTGTEVSIDGIEIETPEATTIASTTLSSPSSSLPKSRRPKSVSEANEQLLTTQNSALAKEYLTGVWAHESAIPEVGGLVCRMPLEVEIYRTSSSDLSMHRKLMKLLDSEKVVQDEDWTSSSSTRDGSSSTDIGGGTIQRSIDDLPSTDEDDTSSPFSPLAAKTIYWYRTAEKLLQNELLRIMSSADANGKINPRDMSEDSLELLQLYMDHQNSWQEVGLVIEKDEKSGSASTVTINRPMAFKLTKNLGRLILLGGAYQAEKGVVVATESNGIETQNIVKFLSAFENKCGVYVGGPDDMDKPAILVHGIHDLPGSVEISPGTGIYRGGLEAAMDGVLAGRYQPLDFRFFIGQRKYVGRELEEAIRLGKYQAVACSRPLVLKQCIQLPKPLWHEVLEFCGGELKEISKLELSKRDDLQ